MTFAQFLLGRARSFRPPCCAELPLDDRTTLYHVAISTELALKAFLAHHGATDAWLARHVRHDLARALDLAESLGLDCGDAGRALVSQLDPYFREGGFLHLREPFWEQGFEVVGALKSDTLIAVVAECLTRPAASSLF